MGCEAEASCHCGAVRLALARAPVEVTECNCPICRRYGVLWAYNPPIEVEVAAAGALDGYEWDDCSISFNRRATRGCVTRWSPNDGRDRMGVNARLIDPAVLAGARVRHLDGAVAERYVD